MKLLGRVLVVLCFLAFLAGQEQARDQRTVRVSPTRLDASACQFSGGVAYATEHPSNAGVFSAHCRDGDVEIVGNR